MKMLYKIGLGLACVIVAAAIVWYLRPVNERESVVDHRPVFATGPVPAAVSQYDKEFADERARPQDTPVPVVIHDPVVKGKVVVYDFLNAFEIAGTYEGRNWSEQQHLYMHGMKEGQSWKEISIPEGRMVISGHLLHDHNQFDILIGLRDARKGYDAHPELYRYERDTGKYTKLFRAEGVQVAPNARSLLVLHASGWGDNSYHLWYPETDEFKTLFSLVESDPASGISWYARWSSDSKAINFYGSAKDFESLNLIYMIDTGQLYNLPIKNRS